MAYAFKFAFSIGNWDPSATTHANRQENSGASTVAVGDLLVVGVPYFVSGDTTMSVTDTIGNTFTEDTNSHFNDVDGAQFRAFYSIATNSGTDTLTATPGVACSRFGIAAACYSGLSGFQVSAASNRQAGIGTGTDAVTSNNANVTSQPAMVVGFCNDAVGSNGATISAGTGYLNRVTLQKGNALADFVKLEDKRVTATGNVAATFTMAASGDDTDTGILVFTEGVVGGGPILMGQSCL